ncbi:hypothetical protein [Paraburkholderia terricola]|uniref:hypothetical protein n=1 Tax=Paraburkholderia terricola TaxID=169427 RepID=UPI000DEFB8D6|nr:hypothetical protein [Paraburkholderia terricola]AXE96314.1 hypothetical protein CUJ90_29485 [Paraburkholderia terricola]
MFTFIVVVALAAFIPYVAAPGIANGVKAINQQPAAMLFEPLPAAAADAAADAANRTVSGGTDAANRTVSGGTDAANRTVSGGTDTDASV